MKYPEGSNLEYDQERMDLGSALRRLGHAVVGHEAEIDQLRETRMLIDALSHMLESTPTRIRDVAQFLGSKTVEFPDGAVITSHICRPGSGPGSPHGLDMVVVRSGERIEARFHGNHLVLLPQFDAEATLVAVEKHSADWILLVPTMMSRISRLADDVKNRYDLSSLVAIWHMAAPCPPWLKEEWCNWLGGERIMELYAGTEAQAVTIIRGDEWLAHRGSVGRCVGGEMKVLDSDTYEELPPGTVGEIFMRSGRGATYKYLGAEARISPDGWESLGDLGKIDEEGYVYLTDRRGDMILSGGANIYPAEVEAALSEHPDVVSSAVIGLPDEDLGNRIHAVVQISQPINEDELRVFLNERLVRYKVPRTFEFTTDAVRDDAGKVRRSALRDERS